MRFVLTLALFLAVVDGGSFRVRAIQSVAICNHSTYTFSQGFNPRHIPYNQRWGKYAIDGRTTSPKKAGTIVKSVESPNSRSLLLARTRESRNQRAITEKSADIKTNTKDGTWGL